MCGVYVFRSICMCVCIYELLHVLVCMHVRVCMRVRVCVCLCCVLRVRLRFVTIASVWSV